MAIRSFANRTVELFFVSGELGKRVGWQRVAGSTRRKLDMLHYATRLDDLRSPPGNRLEALRGNMQGLHSIRINDQWRVVFRWSDHGPEDVEIMDYH